MHLCAAIRVDSDPTMKCTSAKSALLSITALRLQTLFLEDCQSGDGRLDTLTLVWTQSLATVFIIIFVFPSPRPLPSLACINKKFMNSDGHQMAWTVRSARVYRIQRSKSIKLNTDSRVVPWQLEEKYISYHSPTIKNDITRSDACKRRRNSVKSSDVGRQKVPCTS